MLCACTPVNNTTELSHNIDNQNFNKLMYLNDLNERGFAYHQHCLRKTETMNEQYLENFEIAANLLFDETLNTTGLAPQYIVDKIVKRRKHIQHVLNNHYLTKGCQSEEARIARDHYRAFSQYSKNEKELSLLYSTQNKIDSY